MHRRKPQAASSGWQSISLGTHRLYPLFPPPFLASCLPPPPPPALPRSVDLAKAAAGIVVAPEDFTALVETLREGRRLHANFRKALAFYLGAKAALLLLFLLAPFPLSPMQIILLELFMDVGASVTFTLEPADGDLMLRPPHGLSPFFDRELLHAIAGGGISLLAIVLLAGWGGRGGAGGTDLKAHEEYRQSLYFNGWLLGHVFLAWQLRSLHQPLLLKGLASNPAFLVWAGAVLGLLLLLLLLPSLAKTLGVVPLPPREWGRLLLLSLIGTGWMEGWKLFRWYGGDGGRVRQARSLARLHQGSEKTVTREGAGRIVEAEARVVDGEESRLLG